MAVMTSSTVHQSGNSTVITNVNHTQNYLELFYRRIQGSLHSTLSKINICGKEDRRAGGLYTDLSVLEHRQT
jgi:hypothetical protein